MLNHDGIKVDSNLLIQESFTPRNAFKLTLTLGNIRAYIYDYGLDTNGFSYCLTKINLCFIFCPILANDKLKYFTITKIFVI